MGVSSTTLTPMPYGPAPALHIPVDRWYSSLTNESILFPDGFGIGYSIASFLLYSQNNSLHSQDRPDIGGSRQGEDIPSFHLPHDQSIDRCCLYSPLGTSSLKTSRPGNGYPAGKPLPGGFHLWSALLPWWVPPFLNIKNKWLFRSWVTGSWSCLIPAPGLSVGRGR